MEGLKPHSPQVPDGWRVVRLGDKCDFIHDGDWIESKDQGGSDYRLLQLSNIGVGEFIETGDFRWITQATFDRLNCTEIAIDDILTARMPDPIGRTWYVSALPLRAITVVDIAIIRTNADALHPKFLSYFLNWEKCLSLFGSMAIGTTRKRIRRTDIEQLEILLPPLPEQRAIAAVLDSIDEAIESTKAVIAATERLRDSLLHELLTRGVPGRHTEWKDAPGVGTIPACWDVVRLGKVAEVASSQADPRENRFQRALFVAPDDIESGTGRLISRRTVADAAAISGKYQFSKGDVLYSKIRPYLMKVYIPRESGLCSADIYPLRPSAALEPSYLAAVLLTPQFAAYTRTCSDRTGIPKVNRVDLFKYSLSLPPLTEQQVIANLLDSVDDAISRVREERDGLQTLKTSAADALLTGRVRVSEDKISSPGTPIDSECPAP